jgi:hypothetical protein
MRLQRRRKRYELSRSAIFLPMIPHAHRSSPEAKPSTLFATARIADAERAIAALDAAALALSNVTALSAGALRVEAIASARLDGHDVTLAELLLHEAAPPLPATGAASETPTGPGVAAAMRYLDALRHGQRRLAADGVLTGDILLDVLARLRAPGGGAIPDVVATAIAALDCPGRGVTIPRSVAHAVAATAHTVAPLAVEMKEGAALTRMASLLTLCGGLHPWRALTMPGVRALRRRRTDEDFGAPAASPSGQSGCPLERATLAAANDIVDGVAAALCLMQRASGLTIENERRIGAFSQAAHSARLIHVAFLADPVTTLPRLLCDTGLRIQAATSALHRLRALGILREVTGRRRHRVYSYDGWIALLNQPLGDATRPTSGTLSARRDV